MFAFAASSQAQALMANEAKINSIISQMTLEEKVDMLHGKHMFSSAGVERLGIADIEYADGPFPVREYRVHARSEHRDIRAGPPYAEPAV